MANGTSSIWEAGVQGPPGPQGPAGPQGPQGPQGIAGPAGQSIVGPKGDRGDRGTQGVQGIQGPQGIQGIPGPRGVQGNQGPMGPQGAGVTLLGEFDSVEDLPPTGNLGDAYLIAGYLFIWNGSTWYDAGPLQGPEGPQGPAGVEGPQGIQGIQGEQGVQGEPGPIGDRGPDGTGPFREELADFSDPAKGAALIANAIRTIPSVAILRGSVGRYAGDAVQLVNYYEDVPTGGEGLFIWETDATAVDNNGTIIGGAVEGRWVRVITDNIIRPQMFGYTGSSPTIDAAAIKQAAEYASAQGLKFCAQGLAVTLTAALDITLTGKADWDLAESVFTFDLAADVLEGVRVVLPAGYKHSIQGRVRFNFGGKAHTGLMCIQPTASIEGTELYARGVEVSNTEMQVGAGVASSGFCVRGGFQLIRLQDCAASDIKMRAGAGSIGNNGITGILVVNNFGVTGAYARRVEIEGGSVSNVYSLDPAYRYDMDGIGVFANPADTSNGLSICDIRGVAFLNCWGRALKSQAGRTNVEGIRVTLATQPSAGCINPQVDLQTGSGSVKDIRAYLTGVSLSSLVGFQGIAESGAIASTLDFLEVSVAASASLREVVYVTPLSTNIPMVAECRNISVRGTVQNVGRLGVSTFDKQSLHLENCLVTEITQALVHALSVGGGVSPYRGLVSAKNCRNLTALVPLVWSNSAGQTTRVVVSAQGILRGFTSSKGLYSDAAVGAVTGFNATTYPELPDDVRGTGLSAGGSRRLLGLELQPGESYLLPAHGWNCYFANITMGAFRTTACKVVVDSDGAEGIYVGANCKVGLSSEPADGLLKVWGNSGRLVVKNATAAPRIVTVELLG